MFDPIRSYFSSAVGGAKSIGTDPGLRQAVAGTAPGSGSGTSGVQAGGVSVTISTLGSQLGASAARGDERDRTLSRTALATQAKGIIDEIGGDAYLANKARRDGEVPDTDNPALLARARQATAYIADLARGDHAVANPFAGLSSEQLSNIIYDDSGTFTVNERYAAYRASYDIEQTWRQKAAAQAMAEYGSTGKLTAFFSSALGHFNGLLAIEQARYPENYASDLTDKIRLDVNYGMAQGGDHADIPKALVALLFSTN